VVGCGNFFGAGLRVHRRFETQRKRFETRRKQGVPVCGEDLLFARKERKKQIPHPVRKPNGVRNDMFLVFPQLVRLCSPGDAPQGTHGERKMAGFALARS